MRALRKRKPQATQALVWLLRWLAASIDHVYWLALAFVAWKILRNVFCLRNFLAFIAFLAHLLFFLRIFSYVKPCVRAFEWKPGLSKVAAHLQSKAACTLWRPCDLSSLIYMFWCGLTSMPAGCYVVRAALSVLGFPATYLTCCLAARFSNRRLGMDTPTENQNGQPSWGR